MTFTKLPSMSRSDASLLSASEPSESDHGLRFFPFFFAGLLDFGGLLLLITVGFFGPSGAVSFLLRPFFAGFASANRHYTQIRRGQSKAEHGRTELRHLSFSADLSSGTCSWQKRMCIQTFGPPLIVWKPKPITV